MAEGTVVPPVEEEVNDVVTVEWEQPGFGAAVQLAAHDEDSDATPSMLASPEFTLPSVGSAFNWCVPANHHAMRPIVTVQ